MLVCGRMEVLTVSALTGCVCVCVSKVRKQAGNRAERFDRALG